MPSLLQKESIEYVAGTIHRLLQEDVAAEQEDAAAQAAKAGQQVQQDAAAQAAEAGEQQNTAVAAGPGQQQQQQLLPGSSAAAGLASPPQQQQQAVQPAGGWRYRRVYCIATYGIGKERILTGEIQIDNRGWTWQFLAVFSSHHSLHECLASALLPTPAAPPILPCPALQPCTTAAMCDCM